MGRSWTRRKASGVTVGSWPRLAIPAVAFFIRRRCARCALPWHSRRVSEKREIRDMKSYAPNKMRMENLKLGVQILCWATWAAVLWKCDDRTTALPSGSRARALARICTNKR